MVLASLRCNGVPSSGDERRLEASELCWILILPAVCSPDGDGREKTRPGAPLATGGESVSLKRDDVRRLEFRWTLFSLPPSVPKVAAEKNPRPVRYWQPGGL
jgi:hypothetical protein